MSKKEIESARIIPHYGLTRKVLTEELLREVLGIYCNVVHKDKRPDQSGELGHYLTSVDLIHRESVETNKNSEWRIGSYLTSDSKLWIEPSSSDPDVVEISCDANLGPVSNRQLRIGKKMENEFRRAVNKLLLEKKIAIPVS